MIAASRQQVNNLMDNLKDQFLQTLEKQRELYLAQVQKSLEDKNKYVQEINDIVRSLETFIADNK